MPNTSSAGRRVEAFACRDGHTRKRNSRYFSLEFCFFSGVSRNALSIFRHGQLIIFMLKLDGIFLSPAIMIDQECRGAFPDVIGARIPASCRIDLVNAAGPRCRMLT